MGETDGVVIVFVVVLFQVKIDEAIIKAEGEEINKAAQELELDLEELASVVQPIIETCTKDAISVSVKTEIIAD